MISVVVPNYNGEQFIEPFFVALKAQTLPVAKYNVTIVDNGSTDRSLKQLEQFAIESQNVQIVSFVKELGSYVARNWGVNNCDGDVLVFTDIDCQPERDWLERIEAHASARHDYLISGPVNLFPRGDKFSPVEWYDAQACLRQEKYSHRQVGATANLTVSRNLFLEVNGFFPVKSGGDLDFCKRVVKAGGAFLFDESLIVRHPARATLEELKSKMKRFGGGHADFAMINYSGLVLLKYTGKQFIGMILQLNQWRIIGRAFQLRHYSAWWKIRFAAIALYLGVFARVSILTAMISGKRTR